ncbi:hypothetical protein [Serratia bockelmannii]|uniref:hypothetical protein n=1 Tax=Serratia bockelmannii TaxID=2703793 RepID=UPI003FA73506
MVECSGCNNGPEGFQSVIVIFDAGSLLAACCDQKNDLSLFLSKDNESPTTPSEMMQLGLNIEDYYACIFSSPATGVITIKNRGRYLPCILENVNTTVRWFFLSNSLQAYEKILPYRVVSSSFGPRSITQVEANFGEFSNFNALNNKVMPGTAEYLPSISALSYYDMVFKGVKTRNCNYAFTWDIAILMNGNNSLASQGCCGAYYLRLPIELETFSLRGNKTS